MKTLFESKTICLLAEQYFKAVMETASIWAMLPYDTKQAKEAWYWRGLIKETGYLFVGFKTQPPETLLKEDNPNLDPEFISWFNAFEKSPTEMVFVSKKLYEKIKSIKTNACTVLVKKYGTVKTKHPEYKTIPHFCLIAEDFIQELSDAEMRKIKSIDMMVAGI